MRPVFVTLAALTDTRASSRSTFIFAGMDTTSNALARILDLLAKHPDVQDKLRAEILEAVREHGPELPHDVLTELPYLDAVCRETLRLYVPAFCLREWRTHAKIHHP